MKQQIVKIKVPVYEFEVLFISGEQSLKKVIKLNPDLHVLSSLLEDNDDYTEAISIATPTHGFIYTTNLNTSSVPKILRVMSHEIFHIVTNILDYKGHKYVPEEANEPYAYTIGYVTEQLFEKIDFS